jgi:hypothetical protein
VAVQGHAPGLAWRRGAGRLTTVVGRIGSRRHRTLRGRGIAGAVPPGRIGAARGTGLEGCALPLWRNSADRARIAGLTPSRRARRPDAHAPDSRQTRHGAWRHARPPHYSAADVQMVCHRFAAEADHPKPVSDRERRIERRVAGHRIAEMADQPPPVRERAATADEARTPTSPKGSARAYH